MKSDVIHVTNKGAGFDEALAQAEAVARFRDLNRDSALYLRLLTEEMMGMMRALTGEREAAFWIDSRGGDGALGLHLQVKTLMNAEMRKKLLSASTGGFNAAASGFIGKLRDLFESATEPASQEMAEDLKNGIYSSAEESGMSKEDWDELEKSIVADIADDVQIAITGNNVEMIITKKF
jgi:hypothetical protein